MRLSTIQVWKPNQTEKVPKITMSSMLQRGTKEDAEDDLEILKVALNKQKEAEYEYLF